MATYKVPQDVEADDKLLGPLSLKQFLFAIAFFGMLYVNYLFLTINPFLIILSLPFLLITGAFAFWDRKEQPVEIYFSALIRYFTKTHTRVWQSNGEMGLVKVDAPPILSVKYSDDRSASDIESQIDQLSKVINSRGWSIKGVDAQGNPLTTGDLNSDRLVGFNETPKVTYGQSSAMVAAAQTVDMHSNVGLSTPEVQQAITQANQQNLQNISDNLHIPNSQSTKNQQYPTNYYRQRSGPTKQSNEFQQDLEVDLS